MTPARRDVLRMLPVMALAGCAVEGPEYRLAAVGSAWELAQLSEAVSRFPGPPVKIISVGNEIGALLDGGFSAGVIADIALVPEPGLVLRHRANLVPVPANAPTQPTDWEDLLTADGRLYGTWFKVAHKSMVWNRPGLAGAPPDSWDAWVDRCERLAAAGTAPLAIGAADGWVLTDWFENILLDVDAPLFDRLAAGKREWGHSSVRRALDRLARIWSIPGAFPGGRDRALATQSEESILDVFLHGRAAMVAGADFSWPVIKRFGTVPSTEISWFRFPGARRKPGPVLVGGDAIVLFRRRAAALRDWLAGRDVAAARARTGGFLSLHSAVRDYGLPATLDRAFIDDVRGPVAFDLSDRVGGYLAGGDGQGMWKILKDFFVTVASSSPRERQPAGRLAGAAGRAIEALEGRSL